MKKKLLHQVAYIKCKKCPGQVECRDGCLGCGICAEACPSGAITVEEDGCATIDEKKCTGCGKCMEICPQQIIGYRTKEMPFQVACSNRLTGAAARKVCETSCIACGNCVRNCPSDAIKIIDNCAVIDEKKCLSCGFCISKCPRNCIVDFRGLIVKG